MALAFECNRSNKLLRMLCNFTISTMHVVPFVWVHLFSHKVLYVNSNRSEGMQMLEDSVLNNDSPERDLYLRKMCWDGW
jgi:hypothetical protein